MTHPTKDSPLAQEMEQLLDRFALKDEVQALSEKLHREQSLLPDAEEVACTAEHDDMDDDDGVDYGGEA